MTTVPCPFLFGVGSLIHFAHLDFLITCIASIRETSIYICISLSTTHQNNKTKMRIIQISDRGRCKICTDVRYMYSARGGICKLWFLRVSRPDSGVPCRGRNYERNTSTHCTDIWTSNEYKHFKILQLPPKARLIRDT